MLPERAELSRAPAAGSPADPTRRACRPTCGTTACNSMAADGATLGLPRPRAKVAEQDVDSLRPGQPLSSGAVQFFLR